MGPTHAEAIRMETGAKCLVYVTSGDIHHPSVRWATGIRPLIKSHMST